MEDEESFLDGLQFTHLFYFSQELEEYFLVKEQATTANRVTSPRHVTAMEFPDLFGTELVSRVL